MAKGGCLTVQNRRLITGIRKWCIKILLWNVGCRFARGRPVTGNVFFPLHESGAAVCRETSVAHQAL